MLKQTRNRYYIFNIKLKELIFKIFIKNILINKTNTIFLIKNKDINIL
jgi:hypothetical protein